jgi:hypothetical protein
MKSGRKTLLSRKAIHVQKIGWIVAILCAFCWVASDITLPSSAEKASVRQENVWRRTVSGWEKTSEWHGKTTQSPPSLHPGVMSLLMVTFSLSAGIAKSK